MSRDGKRALQGVRETNQTNLQIARENNQYNTAQWYRETEYDKAVNQRARLQEAGLNPYLMMNGGSAGSAASAAPADTSGTQIAPTEAYNINMQDKNNTINALQGAASNFIGFSNSMYDMALKEQQVESMKKQNDVLSTRLAKELLNLDADINNKNADTSGKKATTEKTKSETVGQDILNEIANDTKESAKANIEETARKAKEDANTATSQANIAKLEEDNTPKRIKQENTKRAVDIDNVLENTSLTKEQKQLVKKQYQIAQQDLRTKTIEADIAERTKDMTVKQRNKTAEALTKLNENKLVEYAREAAKLTIKDVGSMQQRINQGRGNVGDYIFTYLYGFGNTLGEVIDGFIPLKTLVKGLKGK